MDGDSAEPFSDALCPPTCLRHNCDRLGKAWWRPTPDWSWQFWHRRNVFQGRVQSNARFTVNDFDRSSPGIDRAVRDFLQAHLQWVLCPLYPSPSVLINGSTPASGLIRGGYC